MGQDNNSHDFLSNLFFSHQDIFTAFNNSHDLSALQCREKLNVNQSWELQD